MMDKLSLIILKLIVECFEDDIDILSLALTCKSHYNNLYKYTHWVIINLDSNIDYPPTTPTTTPTTNQWTLAHYQYNNLKIFQPGGLPSSLTRLGLRCQFPEPMTSDIFPSSLLDLCITKGLKQSITLNSLPHSLIDQAEIWQFIRSTAGGRLTASQLGGAHPWHLIFPDHQMMNILARTKHSRYLSKCQSIEALKIRVNETHYKRKRSSMDVVRVPANIHSVKLRIKTSEENLKNNLMTLLEANPHLTSISMRQRVYRFDVRILDVQSGRLAAWVSRIHGVRNTSKLVNIRLDELLSEFIELDELYPPYYDQDHRDENSSWDDETCGSDSYDFSDDEPPSDDVDDDDSDQNDY
ncbi:hypothetical protein SAMD00019534_073460, partial [Acytostelium subglobosum LB1]|uniref:hypothetical protein n=1 Tax=Acytostelium subglobosum LB1 TaxID=1410327 RepID=UPI0006448853